MALARDVRPLSLAEALDALRAPDATDTPVSETSSSTWTSMPPASSRRCR